MVHFFFGMPRVVFLLSPLAYLLLFQNMIAASPFAIVAYALPHIFHSVATNSRIQRNWRHSFWSEIYETVLALFLVRVTLVTLISPRRGKFNVTEKGGVLARGYFDLRAVYPNIILGLFLILGMARGVYSMSFQTTTTLVFQALLLNTIWAGISLLIILAALAVGREKQQLRAHARVRVKLPIIVHLADGRVLTGEMQNISQSGARAVIERPEDVPEGSDMLIEVPLPSGAALIPSRILRWQARDMLMNFEPKTLADESAIIQCVFGRADAWLDWSDYPKDQPLVSLWRVLVSIGGLSGRPMSRWRPRRSARRRRRRCARHWRARTSAFPPTSRRPRRRIRRDRGRFAIASRSPPPPWWRCCWCCCRSPQGAERVRADHNRPADAAVPGPHRTERPWQRAITDDRHSFGAARHGNPSWRGA